MFAQASVSNDDPGRAAVGYSTDLGMIGLLAQARPARSFRELIPAFSTLFPAGAREGATPCERSRRVWALSFWAPSCLLNESSFLQRLDPHKIWAVSVKENARLTDCIRSEANSRPPVQASAIDSPSRRRHRRKKVRLARPEESLAALNRLDRIGQLTDFRL
jgi:hypothetical protein